jgi:hypothetical protein
MSDAKDAPTLNPEEPGPDSRLTERLLSRATDSLGLIDVRGAEQHYARIMDWLAARTPLLERLRTRYGLTEGEGMTGLAFAEARGQEGSHLDDAGINLSAAPFSFTAPAAEQIFTRVAQIPDDSDAEPTEVKRIARRGVPTFSPASHEPGELFRPALEPTSTKQEQARELQSPSSVREIPVAQTSGTNSSMNPAPPTLPSVEERAAAPSAESESPLARGGAPSTGAFKSTQARPTETNDDAAVNNSTDVNEPSRAAKSAVPRVTESPRPDLLSSLPTSHATSAFVVDEAKEMSLKRVGAPASADEDVKLPVAGETRTASVSAETPRPLAHAREIQAADSGRASASLHAQPPLPLAPSPAAVERAEPTRRQNDGAPAVTRTSSSGVVETFTPGHTRTRADEVNVQTLTEQVSRHLARRLLVERERRGRGRK